MKRYLFLGIVAVIATVVVLLAQEFLKSPQERDQAVIGLCSKESRDTTIPPAEQRVNDDICRGLEELYRVNYGTNPRSASRVV